MARIKREIVGTWRGKGALAPEYKGCFSLAEKKESRTVNIHYKSHQEDNSYFMQFFQIKNEMAMWKLNLKGILPLASLFSQRICFCVQKTHLIFLHPLPHHLEFYLIECNPVCLSGTTQEWVWDFIKFLTNHLEIKLRSQQICPCGHCKDNGVLCHSPFRGILWEAWFTKCCSVNHGALNLCLKCLCFIRLMCLPFMYMWVYISVHTCIQNYVWRCVSFTQVPLFLSIFIWSRVSP